MSAITESGFTRPPGSLPPGFTPDEAEAWERLGLPVAGSIWILATSAASP